jgi:hypothetical protein
MTLEFVRLFFCLMLLSFFYYLYFFSFWKLYFNKKGEMLLSPFLPQIYHKLNLLKIMVVKYTLRILSFKINSTNIQNTRLGTNLLIFSMFCLYFLFLPSNVYFLLLGFIPIKKAEFYFHPFCPKSTINLTY